MFKNRESICYEPDSSPEAWEFYQMYYDEEGILKKNFNFKRPVLYNHCQDLGYENEYKEGKLLPYVNLPLLKIGKKGANPNRLVALINGTRSNFLSNDIESFHPTSRLGGECDFNFNEEKYMAFKRIIGNSNKEALEQLERCRKMHHRFANFSLMQSAGGLQIFKGMLEYDRWDIFIYELNQYFKCESKIERAKTQLCKYLARSSFHPVNKKFLTQYLDLFDNIYEYCKQVYFIEDEEFISTIISERPKKIIDAEDIVRYMNLAENFWNLKRQYFKKIDNKSTRDA